MRPLKPIPKNHIKFKSRHRRLVEFDLDDNIICVYQNMLIARDTIRKVSFPHIRYYANNHKPYRGKVYWWADEWENKHKELLPGAMELLPV